MTRVLVVEDDPKIKAQMTFILRGEGWSTTAVETAEHALKKLSGAEPPDLLVVDVRLPGMSGVDLISTVADTGALPATIVVSGEASVAEAVEALQLGVFDFVEKPFSGERLLRSARNALEHDVLRRRVRELQERLGEQGRIVGASPVMDGLRSSIAKAAAAPSAVLVLGESGSGKELVVDALHRLGGRSAGPLVNLNCAALPRTLVEDELFGHVRGAFTDAASPKPGLFEAADGGTLFLDEIGDMDLALQARLLRVLEDGKVRRLGDSRERTVDVRVVAATNRDLEEDVEAGRFRRDLFYRVAQLVIAVPPLRQREGDVELLFTHFLEQACRQHRARRPEVDPRVLELLTSYRWPGNVRELKNLCQRLVVFGGDPIRPEDLPSGILEHEAPEEGGLVALSRVVPPLPLREFRRRCEREYVESVLQRTGWNVAAAARILGIQRTYLHQKVSALGIRRPE